MARSSKEQASANRQRIVATAGALFRSHGYDAVSIADVMKAAGMTQGGFYKHFASKEALACEAWNAGFAGVAAAWDQVEGDSGEDGPPPVATIVDYYLSRQPPEHRCPMQAHGEDAARSTDGGTLRTVYAEGAGALHDIFLGGARPMMDEDRARLLFAAMVGANMLGRASGDADWVEQIKTAVRRATAPVS